MKKQAFTLIELLIVLAIIALVSALVVPRLVTENPAAVRNEFIAALNGLLHFAWQQSVSSSKPHKISFDMQKKTVTLFEGKYNAAKKEFEYNPVTIAQVNTKIFFPELIVFKKFLIEGFDEMSRFVGGQTTEIWFFVNQQGIAQRVSFLLMQEIKEIRIERWYDLHPFTVQFSERP
jgi:prepilin-type N-terminal cleavage/methylation domain-containing protein